MSHDETRAHLTEDQLSGVTGGEIGDVSEVDSGGDVPAGADRTFLDAGHAIGGVNPETGYPNAYNGDPISDSPLK